MTAPIVAVRSIQKESILDGSTDNETLAQIIVRTAYVTESFHAHPPIWRHRHEFEMTGAAIIRGVSFPASHIHLDNGDFTERFKSAEQGIRLAMERFDGKPPGRAEFVTAVTNGLTLVSRLVFADGKPLGHVLSVVSVQGDEKITFTLPPAMEFKTITDVLPK